MKTVLGPGGRLFMVIAPASRAMLRTVAGLPGRWLLVRRGTAGLAGCFGGGAGE